MFGHGQQLEFVLSKKMLDLFVVEIIHRRVYFGLWAFSTPAVVQASFSFFFYCSSFKKKRKKLHT